MIEVFFNHAFNIIYEEVIEGLIWKAFDIRIEQLS